MGELSAASDTKKMHLDQLNRFSNGPQSTSSFSVGSKRPRMATTAPASPRAAAARLRPDVDEDLVLDENIKTHNVDISKEIDDRQKEAQEKGRQPPAVSRQGSNSPPKPLLLAGQQQSEQPNEKKGWLWFEIPSLFSNREATVYFPVEKPDVVRAKVELGRRLLTAKSQLLATSAIVTANRSVLSSLNDVEMVDGSSLGLNTACVNGTRMTLDQINQKLAELSQHGPYLELEIVETKRKDRGLYYSFTTSAVQYNVVKNAFRRAGFHELTPGSSERSNALWGRPRLKPEEYEQFNEYQRFCHFPMSFQLGRKDNLHRNLSRMRRHYGSAEYGFFPESFLLPEDKDLLQIEFDKSQSQGQPLYMIVKPRASSCGRGIKVINSMNQVNRREAIVQRYIADPLLIDQKKFDLRIYVVVTCFDPLRVYLFNDGLVRFATGDYDLKNKMNNRFVHLTNFSVNKKSEDFIKNQNAEQDGVGSKWTHRALRRYFQDKGIDDRPFWSKVKDLIIKTIISVEGKVNVALKASANKNIAYELFGFDVLIDSKMQPWLLEVNVSPSLGTSSPLDLKVKSQLLSDMLTLVGFVPYERKQFKALQEEERMQRLLGLGPRNGGAKRRRTMHDLNALDSLKGLTPEDLDVIQETEDEENRIGNFERIFPLHNNADHYAQFFESERYRNKVLAMWLKEKAKHESAISKQLSQSSVSSIRSSIVSNSSAMISHFSRSSNPNSPRMQPWKPLRSFDYDRILEDDADSSALSGGDDDSADDQDGGSVCSSSSGQDLDDCEDCFNESSDQSWQLFPVQSVSTGQNNSSGSRPNSSASKILNMSSSSEVAVAPATQDQQSSQVLRRVPPTPKLSTQMLELQTSSSRVSFDAQQKGIVTPKHARIVKESHLASNAYTPTMLEWPGFVLTASQPPVLQQSKLVKAPSYSQLMRTTTTHQVMGASLPLHTETARKLQRAQTAPTTSRPSQTQSSARSSLPTSQAESGKKQQQSNADSNRSKAAVPPQQRPSTSHPNSTQGRHRSFSNSSSSIEQREIALRERQYQIVDKSESVIKRIVAQKQRRKRGEIPSKAASSSNSRTLVS